MEAKTTSAKPLSFVRQKLYEKCLREKVDITQKQMAIDLGLDSWSKLLYHLRPNQESKYHKAIAEYLGCTESELKTGLADSPIGGNQED